MKKIASITSIIAFLLIPGLLFAGSLNNKVVILIAEQNIEGPQRAWWASEVDLSTVEATVAGKLIAAGYDVIDPQEAANILKRKPAFRVVGISDKASVQLGSLTKADYVIVGKAIASAGGSVPQSNMRSCFANLSAKVIRVKGNKVIAYLDGAGNSVHTDVITGGREALRNAGEALAVKIIDALSRGGK